MASTSSRDPATAVTGGTESTLVVELIRAFTTPVGSSSIQMAGRAPRFAQPGSGP